MPKTQKKRMAISELLALAAEPVPLGSGLAVHGRGQYKYVKTNRFDGSTRVFCFRSPRMMGRAMLIGMEADVELPYEDDDDDFFMEATESDYGLH